MKKLICAALITLSLAGCDNTMTTGGVTYPTYGLFNEDTDKNPNIKYHIIIGNVIWAILLCETIIAPVYFIGFSLYEPVGVKPVEQVK